MLSSGAHDVSDGTRPPPLTPDGTRPPALTRAGGRPGPCAPRPAAVDSDVPAAVRRCLEQIIDERMAHCRTLDTVFGEDLAARLAAFTLHGGKMIRPQLLWWSFRAGAGDTRHTAAVLRIAAALEVLQTCALVQDDVMDDAPLRRGRPALHTDVGRQYPAAGPDFAKAAAVLVGDLALAWADDVVAGTMLPALAADAVREIWRVMRTEMVAGQYLDLHGQVTGMSCAARAVRIACLKSGLYSVERPMALGAALAGADARTSQILSAAGRCAGIAFQLRDDLDGVFGAPHTTGKPSGDDIRQGKPTYLVALARARAEASGDTEALAVLADCVGARRLAEGRLAEVRRVLERTGARQAVQRRAERFGARGVGRLTDAAVPEPAGGRLRELLRAAAGCGPGPAARVADDAAGPLGAHRGRR
ncbi:polyprenyl synthetase family protein [Streptomyces sp. NPDC012510]|uniref:polyprenyl synthetase family protein n=1 Tax=Streptomyces sp. NPDC012510 TaxID=3364838 RepID=UPI0036E09A71